MIKNFYSNGKLLITGEYGVLDGGLSLALPTKLGQSLSVVPNSTNTLHWQSIDHLKNMWFEVTFEIKTLTIITTNEQQTAEVLQKMLLEAKKLNPLFLSDPTGYKAQTLLDFPRDWGLGSSSTLLNNIAQWATINPYTLLWNSFTGSGYDIACAKHNTPILYQLVHKKPTVTEVVFCPEFSDALYFIHLNKKQNSREGILNYRKANFNTQEFISEINILTNTLIHCKDLERFKRVISKHETLIGKTLNLKPVKSLLFPDYEGAIKSLGAWGGDFILAAGDRSTPSYFKEKGYKTVVAYKDMIL
ncbi:GYDIA family GHMP kinase [Cellulophaga sp. L1A9]|uniref:GYDIA family GHMP kinase n=1 Tax=Cellulophaga sp. L1A9 TaxID=2686362 RepID=UPI00131C8BDE|nr:GYDIA family GHMP kinase [Cellulophaga sp. L1A9]